LLRIRITEDEEVVVRGGLEEEVMAGWAFRQDRRFQVPQFQKISAIKFSTHKLCMPRNPVYEGSRASCGYMVSCTPFNHVRNPFVAFLTMSGVKYDSYI
jgi:hypothetical protein